MPITAHDQPLTETITIGATDGGSLVAHAWNGPHRVRVGHHIRSARNSWQPVLTRDGAALREALPGVNPQDVLDLLAAGKCGEFEVLVRFARPAARHDRDFSEAA